MKSRLLGLLIASCVLIAAGYLSAFLVTPTPVVAPWLLAIGANGVIMSLMAMGAVSHGTLPRSLAITFIGLFVLCAGAFVIALAMPANEGAGGPLLLGLPLRTAIVLYSVGVLPIVVLPFAYALTFDAGALGEDDLRRVREAYAAVVASRPGRGA